MSAAVPQYDSATRPPRAIEELLELRRHGSLIRELVARNLKVRYKRSALGFLWTMIQPTLMLVVLSLAFTRAFTSYAPAYPLFVFPGLLLWNFFAQTTTLTAEEMGGGGDLWRRVRFPKTALAIANLATGAVNLTLALAPLLAILVLLRRPMGLALLMLPVAIVLTSMFVLGMSLILATGAMYFPDVLPLWNMLLPVLMFTTPVVYPAGILPARLQALQRLNPMTCFIEAFRAPLYSNTAPVRSLVIMLVIAVAALVAGWLLFTHSADEMAYRA